MSAVISDEEEPGPEERNETDNLEVYLCPVFMNRVSFVFSLYVQILNIITGKKKIVKMMNY